MLPHDRRSLVPGARIPLLMAKPRPDSAPVPTHPSTPGVIVPGGYTRVGAILALRPLLEQMRVSWDALADEFGLRRDQFADPDALIPFRQGSRMLGACADRCGCPHLGVLTGKATPLSALGLVAELALAARDVRSALGLVVRHLTLSDGGGLAHLSEGPRYASVSYALYEPGIERAEIIYDHVLGVIWNVLRDLCGSAWRPHEVVFARRRPQDLRPYRSFFRAPLRFDADESAVIFDSIWLDRPIASADAARLRELQAQVEALEAGAGDLPGQVRRVLRRQLLSNRASMDSVASELAMHRRTLDRKLKAFGLNFQDLSDEVRYEVARQLLGDTAMPVIAIAASLHYNDASAFTHAFRRWSGHSPTQWRRQSGRDATQAD